MRNTLISLMAVFAIGAAIAVGGVYTDVSTSQHYNKLGLKSLCDAIDANGAVISTVPSALALTNGQAVTVANAVYLATPAGGTNGATATITLANPTAAGDQVLIVVAAGATNKLGLADSGNLALSAAFAGDANDTITLTGVTTGLWAEVSRSAN